MDILTLRIIETAVVLIVYAAAKITTSRITDRLARKFQYQKPRVKIVKKLTTFILLIICGAFLLFIWGVKQSELLFFMSSLLTVLGIAFFAQWSIISNITSTIIIFVNHPVRIGDTITIMDKEYEIEGRISDIGIFFIDIKTASGDHITLPSNVFIQKMIKKHRHDPDKPPKAR
jgi:small-conductance mechanosensitive channel